MAINPNDINTLRVGQLPPNPFGLSDKMPHEIGENLNQGTVQQLAEVIGTYLGAMGGVSFLPITVMNGQLLPFTNRAEWFLAGKGTYPQTGGVSVVCTEELNAIVSNGFSWSLGVGIPITVDPPEAMISQAVNAGVTNFSPSENAVYLAIQASIPLPSGSVDFPRLLVAQQNFALPPNASAKFAFVNGGIWYPQTVNNLSETNTFTQTGTTVTFKTIRPIGNYIVIFF